MNTFSILLIDGCGLLVGVVCVFFLEWQVSYEGGNEKQEIYLVWPNLDETLYCAKCIINQFAMTLSSGVGYQPQHVQSDGRCLQPQ